MKRSMVAPAVVLVVAVLTGGWLLQKGVDQEQNVYIQVRVFQEVVDHVADQFVDDVDRSSLYEHAIDGLLQGLGDPNTSFIPASDYENFRIETQGDYGGVGLRIVDQDGWVTVEAPIPGTPGARAGIRAGDQFLEIEGTDAQGIGIDKAADLLRGDPGTDVHLRIRRVGVDEPIPFTLTRARIQLKAVPFAVMLEDDVGYVPLQIFRETSSQEVRTAVDSLRREGMRGLVLDLRENPGGLLEEGIGVADLFLEPGQPVVATRGRAPGQDESYRATEAGSYEGLPVVVLVDELSASASEIVAGALQDHDRALVVGNTSYGKGSVQTLFQLSGGNVLRLTTARWYTPAGRSIDRGHDEHGHRPAIAGTLAVDGRMAALPDTVERPTFKSDAGRTLYGGGGITPDVLVMPDTLTLEEQRGVRALSQEGGAFTQALFDYAAAYIGDHPGLQPGFTPESDLLDDFYRALDDDGVTVDRAAYRSAARFVRYHLLREISLQAWGEGAAFQRTRSRDRQLLRAQALLQESSSPEALLRAAGVAPPGPGRPSPASPGDGSGP